MKSGSDTLFLEDSGLLREAQRYFKRLEEGDPDAVRLWRCFRTLSIQRYKKSYARVNVCFDEYAGESQVQAESIAELERVLIPATAIYAFYRWRTKDYCCPKRKFIEWSSHMTSTSAPFSSSSVFLTAR